MFGNHWSTALSQQYESNRQSENQHGQHGKLDDELLRYARRFLVQPIEFCRQHRITKPSRKRQQLPLVGIQMRQTEALHFASRVLGQLLDEVNHLGDLEVRQSASAVRL